MSVRDANNFLEKLTTDPDFLLRVNQAQADATRALAKEMGFDFTQEDVLNAHKALAESGGNPISNRVVDWVGAGAAVVGVGVAAAAAAAA